MWENANPCILNEQRFRSLVFSDFVWFHIAAWATVQWQWLSFLGFSELMPGFICVYVLCFFFKPSEKSRHCITNRIMWKHLHCWKTEGNEPVGWIYFYHLFYFLMKETCLPTFKSLSLQRKTASLIDPCEMVITLMKHRIKLHFFFVLGSTFSFENTLFSTRKEHCLAASSYPIVRHGDAGTQEEKRTI